MAEASGREPEGCGFESRRTHAPCATGWPGPAAEEWQENSGEEHAFEAHLEEHASRKREVPVRIRAGARSGMPCWFGNVTLNHACAGSSPASGARCLACSFSLPVGPVPAAPRYGAIVRCDTGGGLCVGEVSADAHERAMLVGRVRLPVPTPCRRSPISVEVPGSEPGGSGFESLRRYLFSLPRRMRRALRSYKPAGQVRLLGAGHLERWLSGKAPAC
jgi:hypothetical protein